MKTESIVCLPWWPNCRSPLQRHGCEIWQRRGTAQPFDQTQATKLGGRSDIPRATPRTFCLAARPATFRNMSPRLLCGLRLPWAGVLRSLVFIGLLRHWLILVYCQSWGWGHVLDDLANSLVPNRWSGPQVFDKWLAPVVQVRGKSEAETCFDVRQGAWSEAEHRHAMPLGNFLLCWSRTPPTRIALTRVVPVLSHGIC